MKSKLKRFWKWFTIKRRADQKGTDMTHGDLPIPIPSFCLPLEDNHYLRYLVRLDRIRRGLKAFKRPNTKDLSLISGHPWDAQWYCEHIGLEVK